MSDKINMKQMKNRLLKLHWYGNVRRNRRNLWRINCAFLEGKTIHEIDVSIGFLPKLQIGAWYDSGDMSYKRAKEGTVNRVTLPTGVRFSENSSIKAVRDSTFSTQSKN